MGKGKDLGTKEGARFGSKKSKAPGDGIECSYKMSRQTGKCLLILVHTNSGVKKALTNVQIKRSLVIWEKYRCILLHDFLSPLAVFRSHQTVQMKQKALRPFQLVLGLNTKVYRYNTMRLATNFGALTTYGVIVNESTKKI